MKRSVVVLFFALSLGLLVALGAAAQDSCIPAPETTAFLQSLEPTPALPNLTGAPAPIALTCYGDCISTWNACITSCTPRWEPNCTSQCWDEFETCRCGACGICP